MTKLATYRRGGEIRIGIVHGPDDRLFDLAAAAGRAGDGAHPFGSMLDLIDAGPAGLDRARRLFDDRGRDEDLSAELRDVELLAPVPEPRQMRDGMSFETHIRQSGRGAMHLAAGDDAEARARIDAEPLPPLADVYRQMPIYYITNRLIVRGPNTTVRWPRYSRVMDYELEFGIFLSRTGTDISASAARDHVFGYTIFNDFSARDQQMREMAGRLGPAKGKSFDGANVLGPWIVTPDEIGDPYDLAMTARVNGETRCTNRTRDMLFSFEEIIAHMSRDETLFAGEFIGSGTVGNGCGLETGRFLEHGDEIELEVERIGVLRNRVERQN
ncbi:fumarylacetoacetate hydrolase family protein [Lichenibacterium dinghuense]|uniref:fumarylacetoacetate hydrolase family protein n=1 Tax=Lichenibacterium dinghuense TaxID=2895977 RepID=UPI001F18D9DF|nr:fumarylacetoacetate hydrolase family protein [Lichenibacterium sp. 6Y81]